MINKTKEVNGKLKRICAIVVSMGMILGSAPMAVMADDTDTVTITNNSELLNGDFQKPSLSSTTDETTYGKWILETREQYDKIITDKGEGGSFGWYTTEFPSSSSSYGDSIKKAGHGTMELGTSNNCSSYGMIAGGANGTTQFAELCSEDQAALYQNVNTEPGTIYKWSLYHAGRNETETMALIIGAKQDAPLYKPANGIGDGKYDIFGWIGYLLSQENKWSTNSTGMTDTLTVYSKENITQDDLTNMTTADGDNCYKNYFSTTASGEIIKPWTVYVMTTTKGSWVQYSSTYNVPDEQTETTFAFTALSGKKDSDGIITEGNLIDEVVFKRAYPVRVSTSAGGSGAVYTSYTDDGDNTVVNSSSTGEDNGNVTPAEGTTSKKDHYDTYAENDTLTIVATPNDGYAFSGAYINNNFVSAKDLASYTSLAEDKTKFTVSVTKAETVSLVYTKNGSVSFDPAGGTYNESKEATTGSLTNEGDSVTTSGKVAPTADGEKFIGWNAPELGVVVKHDDLSVKKTTSGIEVTYKEVGSEEVKTKVLTTDAITFTAQWGYAQKVTTAASENGVDYTSNAECGTVTMTTDTSVEPETTDAVTTGYATNNGSVTVTAAANSNYRFVGWYNSNGEQLSASSVYTYDANGATELTARFDKTISPYLSFVAKNGEVKHDNEAAFKNGSQTTVDGIQTTNSSVGGDEYGNTISTGFITTVTSSDATSVTAKGCIWTVTIPKATDATPLYIKSASVPLNSNKILDEDNAGTNAGAIYKLTAAGETTAVMYDSNPTNSITIDGDGSVICGIIIDNLYAPASYADVQFTDAKPENATDISSGYQNTDSNDYDYYTKIK